MFQVIADTTASFPISASRHPARLCHGYHHDIIAGTAITISLPALALWVEWMFQCHCYHTIMCVGLSQKEIDPPHFTCMVYCSGPHIGMYMLYWGQWHLPYDQKDFTCTLQITFHATAMFHKTNMAPILQI